MTNQRALEICKRRIEMMEQVHGKTWAELFEWAESYPLVDPLVDEILKLNAMVECLKYEEEAV